MNQEQDWESSEGSNAAFFTGLLAGVLVGTGLGLLFAPRRGADLRGQVAQSAAGMGEAISQTVDEWSDKGREAYDRARDAASRAGDQISRMKGDAEKAVGDAAKTAENAFDAAGDMASGAARNADHRPASGRG